VDIATIAQEVRRFIAENYFLGDDFQFADADSFLDHGIIDSTGILELVGFLQNAYGITIEDEELVPQNLDSITAVSVFVQSKVNGAAQAHRVAVRQVVLGGGA
jgi:acyl carrier protein